MASSSGAHAEFRRFPQVEVPILVLYRRTIGHIVSVYSPFHLIHMTDSELYQKCKEYGTNARLWMRKFEGLLPEVYRRRLYRRRGFASIHEFAAKLAGMSHAKVDRILQLSKKLEDKPKLKEVFENGKVSYSKLKTVAYIANPKTDKIWAEKVQNESQLKLEMAVKREKSAKSVLKDTFQSEPQRSKLTFDVDPQVELKFRALRQKLEKQSGETMSYGEVLEKLMGMLAKEEKIQEEKQVIIKICPDCAKKRSEKTKSRNVPRVVKRLVLARQNNQCARTHCTHPPSDLHHANGYALTKTHSPEGLEYLCKHHHKLAHVQHEHVQIYRRE